MSLVCATLALPIFVAIDVKLDLGAIQVEGLRREVTLKELGVHIQGSYPDLWAWLFRGEDSGLWTYALAACALFCCGLCLLVFGAAVVVRMPYHGRVPTAADLQREVRRGWPCAPVEELRELESG
ncbi:unnamed protein product [Prorocentrum cordatum]|uniref:Uncharacterized protein n=1 Tax=Prorocentrum cordatum TaxID=2364126 RepID=A0ABN9Q399_9DINO|nr:unnamed protein product [Polarella glacialis]